MWRVQFERRAEKEFDRLGSSDQRRVRAFIDDRLSALPDPVPSAQR